MKNHPSLSEGASQCQRLLEVLEKGGEFTVPLFIARVYKVPGPASARLAARIYELKEKGKKIVTRRYRVGKKVIFSYELVKRVKMKV
jgi:hypothetical protein